MVNPPKDIWNGATTNREWFCFRVKEFFCYVNRFHVWMSSDIFCYKLATRVFSTTSSVYKIYKLIAAANNISKLKYSKHKLEWILLCKKSRGRSFKQFRWLENFISSSTQKEHCVHHKYCKTNAQHGHCLYVLRMALIPLDISCVQIYENEFLVVQIS